MNNTFVASNNASNIEYRDQLLYFFVLCGVLIGGIFLTVYFIAIPFFPAILVHILYIFLNLILLVLLKKRHFNLVRYIIVLAHVVQLTLAVFVWFPFDTGYNLLYFMVPMTAFVIMKYSNNKQKYFAIGASVLCCVLFFVSEILPKDFYLYNPGDNLNRLLRGGSILSTIIPMSYIFIKFAQRQHMAHEEMRTLAETDELTCLANRRYFNSKVKEEILRSNRYNSQLSIIMLDLDDFKMINDDYGHDAGDVLLKQISAVLINNVRRTDLVARWGGDEFIIMLLNTDKDKAILIADKLRDAINSIDFRYKIKITASFGISMRVLGESYGSWFKRVDSAIYKAKQLGKNQLVYGDEMHDLKEKIDSMVLEGDLLSGIDIIDEEHQRLLEMLKKANALIAFAGEHFLNEEKIMEDKAFPGLEAHYLAHKELTETAKKVLDHLDVLDSFPTLTIAHIMKEMVLEHFIQDDLNFIEYCRRVEN